MPALRSNREVEPNSRLVRFTRVGLVFAAAITIFAYQQFNRPEPSPRPAQAREATPVASPSGEAILSNLMSDLLAGPDAFGRIRTVQGASISGRIIRLRTNFKLDAHHESARLAKEACRSLAAGMAPIVQVVVLDRQGTAVSRCEA